MPLPDDFCLRRRDGLLLPAAWALCRGAAAQPADPQALPRRRGQRLAVGLAFKPNSLDPALSGNGRAGMHLLPAYEPLLRTLPDGRLAPGLARAWALSEDQREVTFTLRAGARFGDGEPVTAEAARRSILYWAARGGPFATHLAALDDVDVLDAQRLRVRLSRPQPALLQLFDTNGLAGHLISPKALDQPELLARQTAGAGPYRLDPTTTIAGRSLVFLPNPYYDDPARIHWQRIVMVPFEDAEAGLRAMADGQLDLLVSDALTAHAQTGRLPARVRLLTSPAGWTGMVLSDRAGLRCPELGDLRIRRALNHALDRRALAESLLGRFGAPTQQLQGAGLLGHDPSLEQRYPHDPSRARALLAEAGRAGGFEFELAYIDGSLPRRLGQAIAAQLRPLGVRLRLRELRGLAELIQADREQRLPALLFSSNFGPPALTHAQLLTPGGNLNPFRSRDELLAGRIASALQAAAPRVDEAWRAVYARAAELAWFAPVAMVHSVHFLADRLHAEVPGLAQVIDPTAIVPLG